MSISSKKKSFASNAILYAIFVGGAIILVNLLGTRLFGRVDLTEKRIYTLSKASKDLVKTLPDFLSVKAYISKDLPPEIKRLSRDLRDKLDDYKSSSNGRFRWEAVDPGSDKKFEEEASHCNVQKVQIQKVSNSNFELGAYYLGLCLQYGDKTEAVRAALDAFGGLDTTLRRWGKVSEEWSARTADQRPLPRGTPVRVIRQDGLIVLVEPLPGAAG